MSNGLISVGDKVVVDFDKQKKDAVVRRVFGFQIQCGVNLFDRDDVSLWPSYWFEPYQVTKEKK